MKTNITTLLVSMATIGVLGACGDSGTGGGGTGGTTSSTGAGPTTTSGASMTTAASTGTGMMMFPAMPTLGTTQIDRMGRPAINTATDDTFLVPNGASFKPSDDATRAAAEDTYNGAKDSSQWATLFTPTMALNLGVLDALDGNCENQLASCGNDQQADGKCYTALAGVLADDKLWVKTTNTSCGVYLAVEADALGVIVNGDCGGRRPVDDVIQTTYSVVALGAVSGFDDGITPPQGLHPDTFPFMAAPH
jgi:hypothetical protein